MPFFEGNYDLLNSITVLKQFLQMSNFYEQLCQSFIRPSRQTYNAGDLGQPISQNGKRYDFHVYNNRKLKILCSYFSNNHNSTAPCLVYLHSLNGSRLQSLSFAEKVLAKGLNFCSFDFSGTGLSQGKYVSLGYHEKYDILAVIQYICEKFFTTKFILWGRSMGAAATIKFMSMMALLNKNTRNNLYQIEAIILDSPFYSLSQITVQIAKQKVTMPEIFIKAVLMMVQSSIQKKAGFKISQMQMLEDMKLVRCPVLILTSKQDKLVNSTHSQKLYQVISHKDRQIIFIKGQHNSNRENDTIQTILNFACRSMNKRKIGKQMLARSTKLLNYKVRNNLVASQAIGSKSSNKLFYEESSAAKIETCGDEEVTSYKCDQQNDDFSENKKISQCKKSLHIYSPKINNSNSYKKTYMNIKNIPSINNSLLIISQPTDSKLNLTQKKFNIQQNKIKNDINVQFQSDKKIENYHKSNNSNRPYIQINKTPIKQPPIFNLLNKFSNQIPKTPEKTINSSIKMSQELGQRIIQSQKRGYKQQKNQQQNKPIQKANSSIQVNHFNVINDKLKKKKRKEEVHDISPKFKQPQQVRTISVSMERKSQIPIKAPPQFLRTKLQQQNFIKNKNG